MKKDEVRCLRLKRDQLLELLWACYRGMGYKGLKLPGGASGLGRSAPAGTITARPGK